MKVKVKGTRLVMCKFQLPNVMKAGQKSEIERFNLLFVEDNNAIKREIKRIS